MTLHQAAPYAGMTQTGSMGLISAAQRARHRESSEADRVRDAYERDDGLWDIEAHLTDTKTTAHSRHHGGRERRPGEPVHRIEFALDSQLSERVIFPSGPTERQGMEDARFVRFRRDDPHQECQADEGNQPGIAQALNQNARVAEIGRAHV